MDTNSRTDTDCTPEHEFGFLINDTARLMRRAFDRRVKRLGVTRAQWFVLAYLHRNDGQTQTDLAVELDMEKAPLGKLLDRLEQGGWIVRRLDPDDRRANRVFMTSKIEPLIEDMREEARALYHNAMAGLASETQEQLMQALRQVKENLLAQENVTDEELGIKSDAASAA